MLLKIFLHNSHRKFFSKPLLFWNFWILFLYTISKVTLERFLKFKNWSISPQIYILKLFQRSDKSTMNWILLNIDSILLFSLFISYVMTIPEVLTKIIGFFRMKNFTNTLMLFISWNHHSEAALVPSHKISPPSEFPSLVVHFLLLIFQWKFRYVELFRFVSLYCYRDFYWSSRIFVEWQQIVWKRCIAEFYSCWGWKNFKFIANELNVSS